MGFLECQCGLKLGLEGRPKSDPVGLCFPSVEG